MAVVTGGAKPTISLAGQRLDVTVEPLVVDLSVETDATGPDICVLTLADEDRDVVDRLQADFFQELKVEAAPPASDDAETLFEGTIYSVELQADVVDGVRVVIVAYDGTYALRNGLVSTTYNNVKDSDLAHELASDADLAVGVIEPTSVVHEHVSQVNETHWDFLTRRAAANDYELTVVGKELHFRPSPAATNAPEPGQHGSRDRLQLTVGGNLESFYARTSAAQQVTEVEVRGWDPVQKQAITATAPPATRGAALDATGAEVAGRNGSPRFTRAESRLAVQAQVDALATAEAERIASTFAYAEGVAQGDPRLRAGTAVSVGQSGRFDGQYTITRATHRYSPEAGYQTEFVVSGRHDRSLWGLTAGTGGDGGAGSFPGVYPAVVTNLKDPEALGRVKLELPWLGDAYETDWSRLVQIGAGDQRGLLWFPEVGDEVLVAFVGGDPRYPVVVGGLYNGQDQPPLDDHLDDSSGQVQKRCLKTREGHRLVFDDTAGKELIELVTADGQLRIELKQENGAITIEAPADVVVTAGGKAELTSQGDMKLSAGGNLEIEAAGRVEVKGAVIKLN